MEDLEVFLDMIDQRLQEIDGKLHQPDVSEGAVTILLAQSVALGDLRRDVLKLNARV